MSRALRTVSFAIAAAVVMLAFALLAFILAGRLTVGTTVDALDVLTGFKSASTHAQQTELERLRAEARLIAQLSGGSEFREALHEELRRSGTEEARLRAALPARQLRRMVQEELGVSRRARLSRELLEAQAGVLRAEMERERLSLVEFRKEVENERAEFERIRDEFLASHSSETTKSLARLYLRMNPNTVAEEITERWEKGETREVAAVLRAMGEHAASSVLEGIADISLRVEIVRGAWGGIR